MLRSHKYAYSLDQKVPVHGEEMLLELQGAAWRDSADHLLLVVRSSFGSGTKPARLGISKKCLALKQCLSAVGLAIIYTKLDMCCTAGGAPWGIPEVEANMGGVTRRVGPNHTPWCTLLCHRVRVSWHKAQLPHQHQVQKSPMQLPVSGTAHQLIRS